MSSINQILNSALMESSTNLDEARAISHVPGYMLDSLGKIKGGNSNIQSGQQTGSNTVKEPLNYGKDEKTWLEKLSGHKKAIAGIAGGTVVVGGAAGGTKMYLDNKDAKAASDAAAAQAATLPAEPPKSFVQKYGDQAKEMWNNALANPNAGKYGAAGLVALGAGIGAVALAKKLRAKKAAVKK